MKDILENIRQIKASGKRAALCIIVETKGSSPRKAGSKMIVYEDKTIEGTIGGGSLEMKVMEDAPQVIESGTPQKFSYNLEDDLGMHCGGYAEVYIEPILPDEQLYIFGAGHVGKALADLASQFGFEIILVDPREEIIKGFQGTSYKFIRQDFVEAAKELAFGGNAYIVITTPKHKYDEDVLAVCAKKAVAYVGMIGSKNKVALAKKRFLEESILTQEEIDRVDMPIGIKFNAQTPEEIAVSILAKLIDVKNSKNK
ncbi:MAG TPA: XdhC family protein [Bacteroidales bacterium]|nr:XdhC family protein [Bacteroidales bacterium]HRX96033.1 XdhC family protein [Bacteroidales bacterium]